MKTLLAIALISLGVAYLIASEPKTCNPTPDYMGVMCKR